MKSSIKRALLLSTLVLSLAGCGKTKVNYVTDDNPYTFSNPKAEQHAIDSDMTIDGEFNEDRWKSAKWLNGIDRISKTQYADIKLATSFSKLGIYFGLKVNEHGTNIYVNHERASYFNSCIEMYMASPEMKPYDRRCMEIDFLADGTYSIREYFNDNGSWSTVYSPDAYLPITASKTIGGEVNTTECTGYTYEVFFPFEFLDLCGYDVSDKENFELAINPVHITSFSYNGTDLNEDRLWSDWSQNYISSQWLTPSSWFFFDKAGYCCYTYDIQYEGSAKGVVKEKNSITEIMKNHTGNFTITPINDSSLTKLVFNGEDVTDKVIWSNGIGSISLKFTQDSTIVATFD